jgi:2-methylcitrate dehydratase PrpD
VRGQGAAQRAGARVVGLLWSQLTTDLQRRALDLLLVNSSVALAGLPYVVLPPPSASASARFPVFAGGRTEDAAAAIRYNAAAMHARTQDDFSLTHSGGHIGTCVIPAAVAAVSPSTSGAAFLEAIVAGYMLQMGLARTSAAVTMRKGFRSVGLYGGFGAIAAVTKLRQFDATQTANSIGLICSMAAGTGQCWVDGSDEWQLHPGLVACNALLAADLTTAGVRAAPGSLEGPAGFYRAYAGLETTPDQVEAALDASWALNDVTFKRHPASGICQPVIDASAALVVAGLDWSEVDDVQLRMHPGEAAYPGTTGQGPFVSVSDALMSAAYCTACVLMRGHLDIEDLHDSSDPRRLALAGRVHVVADEDRPYLQPAFNIRLRDGKQVEHVHDAGTAGPVPAGRDLLPLLWKERTPPPVTLDELEAAVSALPAASTVSCFIDVMTRTRV